mmetsp:Transcript_55144/g.129050  ORF Transcript_55144/g.129050 Transcript_55144/m.129050 type:complete len:340 (-) Transcript_55144:121-1140(-)
MGCLPHVLSRLHHPAVDQRAPAACQNRAAAAHNQQRRDDDWLPHHGLRSRPHDRGAGGFPLRDHQRRVHVHRRDRPNPRCAAAFLRALCHVVLLLACRPLPHLRLRHVPRQLPPCLGICQCDGAGALDFGAAAGRQPVRRRVVLLRVRSALIRRTDGGPHRACAPARRRAQPLRWLHARRALRPVHLGPVPSELPPRRKRRPSPIHGCGSHRLRVPRSPAGAGVHDPAAHRATQTRPTRRTRCGARGARGRGSRPLACASTPSTAREPGPRLLEQQPRQNPVSTGRHAPASHGERRRGHVQEPQSLATVGGSREIRVPRGRGPGDPESKGARQPRARGE